MPEEKKWQFELEEYIRQGEPEQTEKCEYGRLQSDCRMWMVSKLLLTCWIQPKDILREK